MAGGRAGDLDGPKGTEIKRLWGRRCPCERSWRHDPKTGWPEKVSGRLLGRTAPERLAADAG